MGTGACFKNRTRGKREEISWFFLLRQFFARALYRLLALYFAGSSCGPQREVGWHEAPGLTSVCFVCFLYMFFLPVTSIDTFLRFVVSCSSIRITFTFSSRRLTHHVTGFDQWKQPFMRSRGGNAAGKRICSSSTWGISKPLAVFISFAVMGWFYLLTKRFIRPSCDEIEAKMASTWLHFLCRIPEV